MALHLQLKIDREKMKNLTHLMDGEAHSRLLKRRVAVFIMEQLERDETVFFFSPDINYLLNNSFSFSKNLPDIVISPEDDKSHLFFVKCSISKIK